MLPLVAAGSTPDEALNVYMSAALNAMSLNVATPATAGWG